VSRSQIRGRNDLPAVYQQIRLRFARSNCVAEPARLQAATRPCLSRSWILILWRQLWSRLPDRFGPPALGPRGQKSLLKSGFVSSYPSELFLKLLFFGMQALADQTVRRFPKANQFIDRQASKLILLNFSHQNISMCVYNDNIQHPPNGGGRGKLQVCASMLSADPWQKVPSDDRLGIRVSGQ